MGIEEYKEAMTDYLPSWSGLVVSFPYKCSRKRIAKSMVATGEDQK
jgi:nitrogen fixation protein FixH